jgi:L-ascorbate metabolism protein UlaG (beta-lactamase superfamily)
MIKIQRLNMDNSWLLTMDTCRLLIDPWLMGVEVDFFPWFNTQWHKTAPIALAEIPEYDAVLITQKYPDHFHQETLKKLRPKKIIAPKSIEKKLRGILPESEIIGLDKQNSLTEVAGVKIQFMNTARKIDPIYDAFLLDNGKKSVFLATHGFSPSSEQVKQITQASPCALLVNPFNHYELPVFLGGVVSPGLEGVEQLCQLLQPDKIVATHDEDKHAKGLVTKFAKITPAGTEHELAQLPWLSNRIIHLSDYQPTLIA